MQLICGSKSPILGKVFIILLTLTLRVAFSQTHVIYFEHDSYELLPEFQKELDSLSETLLTPDYSITLDGYCDKTGNYRYNLFLSQKRAKVAAAYLTNLNPHHIIKYQGHSYDNLASTKQSEEGKSKNRRVEINVEKANSSPAAITITGKLTNKHNERLDGEVTINDLSADSSEKTTILITKGKMTFELQPQHKYNITFSSPDHFYRSGNFEIDRKQVLDVKLSPIIIDKTYQLKHIGFVPSEARVLEESIPELENLLYFMTHNPTINIRIEGHTNSVRSSHPPEWHQDLSERRAAIVKNYLMDNGIASARLSSKGFGDSKMLYPNARNKSETKKNRRVEIRITKK